MIKKYFLLFFFLISSFFPCFSQPALTLDWIDKEPVAYGKFIKHDNQKNSITVGLAGTNPFGTYVKLYIAKHDTSGNLLWKHLLNGNGGLLRAKDVLIDSANNIYVTGRAHYDAQFAEGVTLKYDSQGNLKWVKYYGLNEGLVGEFNQMTLFDNRYIYVAGTMDSISGVGATKGVLVKYDANGNFLWVNSDSLNYGREGISAEVDKSGNVYLVGSSSCCLPGGDMFVEKYDSSGNKQWETVALDTAYQYGHPNASTIDDSSNIYVTGEIEGLNVTTGFDCGVIKIDSSGNLRWFRAFVSSPSNQVWEIPKDIFVDKNYNCYVSGFASNGYIVQYNINGIEKWRQLGNGLGGNGLYSLVNATLINDSTIIMGGSGVTQSSPRNFLVFSLDTSGTFNWQLGFPYYNNCNIFDFSTLDLTFCFTGGIADTNFTIDDSLFTLKFNYSTLSAIAQKNRKINLLIYPNPVNQELNIILDSDGSEKNKVFIYNSTGQLMYISHFSGSTQKINTVEFNQGIYLIEIINDSGALYKGRIIKQ